MTGLDAWRSRAGLRNGRGAIFDAVLRDEDINCEEDWIVLNLSPLALKELADEVESALFHAFNGSLPPFKCKAALYFSVKASHPKTETPAGAHGPSSGAYTTFHSSLLTPSLEDEPGSRFYGDASSDFPDAVQHAEQRLTEAMKIIGKLLASAVPNQTEHPTMFAAHEEAEEFVRLVHSEYGAP